MMIENPWLTFSPTESEPKVHLTDLPFSKDSIKAWGLEKVAIRRITF